MHGFCKQHTEIEGQSDRGERRGMINEKSWRKRGIDRGGGDLWKSADKQINLTISIYDTRWLD